MFFLIILIFISIFLIIISKVIKFRAERTRKAYKILDGDVVYSDLDISAKPLFSKKYGLSGKPDYIIKRGKHYIPIELKSGNYENPQKNHIFQLAAYCQLVEENFKVFVPYGIIVYNDGSQFKIPFDPRIRFELEKTLREMRKYIKESKIDFEMKDNFKCKGCSMREYCNIKSKF